MKQKKIFRTIYNICVLIILIAVALFAFCLYAGGFYFLVDSSIAIEQLRRVQLCRVVYSLHVVSA